MKKILNLLIIALLIPLCISKSMAVAATLTADPEIYKITIHQVRVYNQTNGQWYVAGTGDITFDITSAGAGAVVGNYISNASLAEGTYTQVEVTLSRTFLPEG